MFTKTKKLLAISADAKTIKGNKLGVMTGVLYLAPNNVSGYEVCPKATAGCKAACLYTAGRGIYSKCQTARINKTKWFFEERDTFMALLVENINALIRKAHNNSYMPAVRLNGTSDIAWEKFKVIKDGVEYRSIFHAFPDVQFYDYTAVLGRASALKLSNYHLTFSLKENNDKDARSALLQGYNLAVVFKLDRTDAKPVSWQGYPVINGDETDVRFMDTKGGHIVGLFPKGKARYDTTGFVRSVDSAIAA
jgi:hypothetical protein